MSAYVELLATITAGGLSVTWVCRRRSGVVCAPDAEAGAALVAMLKREAAGW